MMIPLPAATARIRRELLDAETKVDEALVAAAKLMQSLVLARQNPELAANTGQKALIRLVRAQQSIVNGSSDMFRVHDEVGNLAREMAIVDEPGITRGSGLTDDDLLEVA